MVLDADAVSIAGLLLGILGLWSLVPTLWTRILYASTVPRERRKVNKRIKDRLSTLRSKIPESSRGVCRLEEQVWGIETQYGKCYTEMSRVYTAETCLMWIVWCFSADHILNKLENIDKASSYLMERIENRDDLAELVLEQRQNHNTISNVAVEAAINAERAEDSPDRARTPPTIQRPTGTTLHADGRPLPSDSSSSAAISSSPHNLNRRGSEHSQALHYTIRLQPSNSSGTIPSSTSYELPNRRPVVNSSYAPSTDPTSSTADIAVILPSSRQKMVCLILKFHRAFPDFPGLVLNLVLNLVFGLGLVPVLFNILPNNPYALVASSIFMALALGAMQVPIYLYALPARILALAGILSILTLAGILVLTGSVTGAGALVLALVLVLALTSTRACHFLTSPPTSRANTLAGSLAYSGVLALAFGFAVSSIPNRACAHTLTPPSFDIILSGILAFSGAVVVLDWDKETGVVIPNLWFGSGIAIILAIHSPFGVSDCVTGAPSSFIFAGGLALVSALVLTALGNPYTITPCSNAADEGRHPVHALPNNPHVGISEEILPEVQAAATEITR